MENYVRYQLMKKPKWAPRAKVFGPVWSVLYLIITITFGTVFYQVFTGQLPLIIVLPFVLNLIFNILFTPIQFGLKSNILGLLDIVLVLITLVWLMVAVYPYIPLVALANIPYLLWVCFATVLQIAITYLNRKTGIRQNTFVRNT
jgi:tryptophan-rich sensory protein